MVEPPAPPPPPEGPPATPPPEPPASPAQISARGPDLFLLIAGAIFLVATFLPWYRLTLGRGRVQAVFSDSAWGSGGLGVLAAIFGVGAAVVVLSVVAGSKGLSAQNAALLALVLSAGALVFTLLRLAFRPKGSAEVERLGGGLVEITRGFGLWLAVCAAVVMAVAAYQKYRRTAV